MLNKNCICRNFSARELSSPKWTASPTNYVKIYWTGGSLSSSLAVRHSKTSSPQCETWETKAGTTWKPLPRNECESQLASDCPVSQHRKRDADFSLFHPFTASVLFSNGKAFLGFSEENPQTMKELKFSETSIFTWVGDINIQKLKSYVFSYYCDFPTRKYILGWLCYI